MSRRLSVSRHLAIDKQSQRRVSEEPLSAAKSELSTAALRRDRREPVDCEYTLSSQIFFFNQFILIGRMR